LNILVLGSGGREHALSWSIKSSKLCKNLYCIPGNGGIEKIAKCLDLDLNNKKKILEFCKKEKIDLVIVGPENLLEKGFVDYFTKNGIKIFGPSKKGAKLESSKTFAKNFMKKNGIPSASYRAFSTLGASKKYIKKKSAPYVIKVNGLAAGKGVIISDGKKEAYKTLEMIFNKKKFGKAGKTVLIEEFLTGYEISFFTFIDKKSSLNLGYALDHKKLKDKNLGPNTGGMGAFAPSIKVNKKLLQRIQKEIINPTVEGIRKEKVFYNGIIFFGLMITEDGPKVIEYNTRFGDPECQTLIPLIKSDFLMLIRSTIENSLSKYSLKVSKNFSVCVVLTTKGYPEKYKRDIKIERLENIKCKSNENIYHAATYKKNGSYFSNGGRVLCVVCQHTSLTLARENAYKIIKKLNWTSGFYRKDIGLDA
tara:strand:+ start:9610 stop:10872 length:1263 start_codon:yes stop_codon:yes gene_type:complete